jgi:hypothetical protein
LKKIPKVNLYTDDVNIDIFSLCESHMYEILKDSIIDSTTLSIEILPLETISEQELEKNAFILSNEICEKRDCEKKTVIKLWIMRMAKSNREIAQAHLDNEESGTEDQG